MLLLLGLLLAAAPKLAVLDVRLGEGIDKALGPYVAQVLAKEVADRTGTPPLVSTDVTAMLGFERNKRMLGCDEADSSCVAEISGALGVSQVLATSVSLAGGRYLITLSLLDTRRGQPLKRAAESAPREDEELLKVVRRCAFQIFGGVEPAQRVPPAPAPGSWTRRRWAVVAFSSGAALAIGGAIAGATALSAANRSDAASARPRAVLADALFGTALLASGAGVYLWISGKPVELHAAAAPAGLLASARLRW